MLKYGRNRFDGRHRRRHTYEQLGLISFLFVIVVTLEFTVFSRDLSIPN
jgi:hypothetical protein